MSWTLHPKELDGYVEALSDLGMDERLRQLKVVRVSTAQLDVHEAGFARAYRMKAPDGSSACLRFWLDEPDSSLLTTYSALEAAPQVCLRSGLPQARIFPHAFSSAADDAIPAVLMDWVEGSALGDCIDDYAGEPANLNSIADALLHLFVRLNAEGTSHGDLRASNILMQPSVNSIRPAMIDLDSLRWRGGPVLPRAMGGNSRWREIERRDRVEPLQHDYLDQALTYLAIVAVAQDRNRWKGSTEVFLTPYALRGDGDEILRSLEKVPGAPSRLAIAVQQVIQEAGHWNALQTAMSEAAAPPPLEAGPFWDILMARKAAAPFPFRPQQPKPPAPPRRPAAPSVPAPPAQPQPSVPAATPADGFQWFWIVLLIIVLAAGAAWWYFR